MSTFPVQFVTDASLFVIVCLPLVFFQTLGKPISAGFWCDDQSLSYPFKPDTIPQSLLLTVSFGIPFLVIAVTESIRAAVNLQRSMKFKSEMMNLAKAYSVFLFGMTINCIFTDAAKFSAGRPRPHFFDVCKPNFTQINCTTDTGNARFITEYECTNRQIEHKWIHDSTLSFPSGHSSVSMYSATFIILYLQMRMNVRFSYLLKPALQACVLMLALYCCISRVTDHKHFSTDVIAGSIIGIFLALAAFYRIACPVLCDTVREQSPRRPRAASVESEPRTPTPLLRPERIVIDHGYKNNAAVTDSKGGFLHKFFSI